MAHHVIDFSNKKLYRNSLNALHVAMTDNGWPRRSRKTATGKHTVTVGNGGTSVTLYLREKDLYIIGFRLAGGGHVYFKDDKDPNATGTVTELGITGRYTGNASNHASAIDSTTIKNISWGRSRIEQACNELAGYDTSSGYSNDFRLSASIFFVFVSEAMRFHEVFLLMQKVVGGSSTKVTFAELAPVILNWNNLSTGNHDDWKRLKTLKTQ